MEKRKKVALNATFIKQFLQYYTIKKHLLPSHVILKPCASILYKILQHVFLMILKKFRDLIKIKCDNYQKCIFYF